MHSAGRVAPKQPPPRGNRPRVNSTGRNVNIRSPLPWAARDYDPQGGYDCMYPGIEIIACNTTVALVDGGDYPIGPCTEPDPDVRAEMEGNAEFIVRACNCHDDLVVALDCMMATRRNADSEAGRLAEAAARAAIRKAKGEKPC